MEQHDAPAVQPIVWMRSLRDAAAVSGGKLTVLLMLALRMRKDGNGWAAQSRLAEDAGVSVSTVERAIKWAIKTGFLVRTRRGHRISDTVAVASEYRLTQPVTGAGLDHPESGGDEQTQPVISEPNPSNGHSQPVTGDGLRGLLQGVLSPSVPPFGGSPVGDLDEIASEEHKTPFLLGKRVAEVCNDGLEVWPEQFRDLVLRVFDFEDERAAWAGFHRYRCEPRGKCACHHEDAVTW